MLLSLACITAVTLGHVATAPSPQSSRTSGPTLTVHLDQPSIEVSRNLYGLFFEEINWAGDGGIYAEMVRNRGFTEGASHWIAPEGTLKVEGRRATVVARSETNLVNPGFAGMGLRSGMEYRLKLRLKSKAPTVLSAYLADGKDRASNRGRVTVGTDWTNTSLTLKATKTSRTGSLVVELPAGSEIQCELVSMFPGDAVAGFFRKDLFETLKKMKPAFVRFPGGCWVEGDTMETAYRWKSTIGPLTDRAAVYNLWRYQSTNGLGYHEYLELCRLLKADPMFVANCGMSHREVVPMDKMDTYVQDVLDAIEYANGPVTSKWGALRAQHGSPKPYGLKYLEVGNENGGPAYEERYGLIQNAIKSRYPGMTTIANVWGGYPQKTPIEMLDEHYYFDPGWFLEQFNRYDNYDRKGPKIYVGEYAVTQGVENGNLRGALAEGVFMLGMERNSDIVALASYAPLLAHPAGKAWNPDLIYFDGLNVIETPSYHVQALFAQNRPERMLRTTIKNVPMSSGAFPAGGVGVGTWATSAEFRDLKVIQGGKTVFSSNESQLSPESGNWSNANNVWKQDGKTEGARAYAEIPGSSQYRVELKAKKISGDEGFLVTVGRKDAKNFIWLNLGGWGNSQHALEWSIEGGKRRIGANKPGRIETGRTYDIAIDFEPDRIKCYLDGTLLFDEVVPRRAMVFGNVGTRGGETIVKLINVDSAEHTVNLEIPGGASMFFAEGTLLQADDDRATSTFENPNALTPKGMQKHTIRNGSRLKLPRHSLTILRLKPQGNRVQK